VTLHSLLKHIFDSPITEGMRVIQGDSKQTGIISFSGHPGDWFQPRTPEDCTITLGRDIPDSLPPTQISPLRRKIVSIDKLLDKAEKTLLRNGSVLVCGGRGAGKSAALKELSNRMHRHLLRIALQMSSLICKTQFKHHAVKSLIVRSQPLKIL
jgi:hypothetical protein